MVKIFIGNLSQHAGKDEVEALFTQYGTVTECAKYKNYAFVHMEDRKSATKAIRELHLCKLNGRSINVEPSRGKYQGPVKLHVANVERGFDKELRELFEEYGTVTECSIVKNFAFVHMLNSDEAMDAIQGLDNTEFQGKRIHVQISKSRARGAPEEEMEDYPPPPGRGGYYPPHYPGDRPEPPYRGRMHAYPPPPPQSTPPPPPPRRAPYPDHGYGDGYGVVDYYQRFRARPNNTTGYDDRRSSAIPPPPPPPALLRERLGMGTHEPYEHRMPPTPPPLSSMMRDRSPIRRPPPPPAPSAGNGYSYERSRLSPLPNPSMYAAPRPRDSFSEGVPMPPPPPPPRYADFGGDTAPACGCRCGCNPGGTRRRRGTDRHKTTGSRQEESSRKGFEFLADTEAARQKRSLTMVKIFVGNLPREADQEEIKALFTQYGTVTECAIIKNYAFVHMDDRKAATKAIKNLHLYKLHGTPINVEASHGKNQGSVKLHVANVEKGSDDELRALFEEYGTVTECAVVKNFAFVHMSNSDEAMDAIKGLDNTEFQGKRIHVQISKSRPRHDERDDYPPPPPDRGGYWPPRYPGERHEPPPPSYLRGRLSHIPPGYPAPPLPPPPPRRAVYPDRPYEGERDRYGVVDYYEKYRARPYGIASYEDQRAGAPPPPPPPSAVVRDRLMTSSLDPYERRPLPPPPSSYYARDRSPLRRAPSTPMPPASNGYSYERSRLSPVSRVPAYGVPRARDPYADRLPPPPPARYAY
ncbi:RNA-binding protein 4.3 [Chelmon rostratus]|uniref:RNA-binding protein 4.3 n=1 Tax=Chelmon rostratus TaxID=109905 RepID=UPI001BE80CA7|nr:RNA-binding protein 4.3 [Chelmon rostratus]